MAFRPESRWWIVTLLIVGVLMAISALALNRPDVEWDDAKPHCPACREAVNFFSSKCARCTAEFDWVAAGDDESPISSHSLSALEAEHVRKHIQQITLETAVQRVVTHLGLSAEDAQAYLEHLGRGRCGWCGGTGHHIVDSDANASVRVAGEDPTPCRICQGVGACVGCGGDMKRRLGEEGAHRALGVYQDAFQRLTESKLPDTVKRTEAWRLAEEFLGRYAGTVEAAEVMVPTSDDDGVALRYQPAVVRARKRLDRVLEALHKAE